MIKQSDLQNLKTIRSQAQRILSLARQDKLTHFRLHEERKQAIVDYVLEVMNSRYPTFDIPYHSRWRHFEASGINRIAALQNRVPRGELGKVLYELVILSVLLDAGAGNQWCYREPDSGKIYSRSEGLALASLDLYLSGAFSADASQPLRVDAKSLLAFSQEKLISAFQVSKTNPLEGVEGRVDLLNRLAKVLKQRNNEFGNEGRLGNFYSTIHSQQRKGCISATKIFQAVLEVFNDIWPKRSQFQGVSLGDVFTHPALKLADHLGSEFIPFHKLSQWLTYSLIEPLEQDGVEVTDLDTLTGLPEYRNGGLLVDMGLLEVKNPQVLKQLQASDSELIIEWRALTVALLDELADAIRLQLKMTRTELPLAKILQGGTWEAGRRIAKQKRSDGRPPIQIISDGTLF